MQDEATRYSSYASAALLDHVDDCVVVVDRDGRVIYANHAAERRGIATILRALHTPAEAARAAGQPVESVEAGWWVRATPTAEGGLALLTRRDRTLPFSSRFDALFELTPTDLLILQVHPDASVVVERANAGFCRTTGVLARAVAGQPVDAVLPPDTAGILAANARICVAQGGFDGECELAFPAGELLVRTVYRLIPSDGSAIDRVLLTQMDLTETRRIEAALRQALRLEVVGQLTGGVAHDFNNLLTAVLGSLDLLNRHVGDDRQRRWIQVATDAAQRGATLTQQLLAYARKQFLEPVATDIVVALNGMTALIRGSLGGNIGFETDFAPGTWLAHTDIGQLELALLNLMVNARTAMPKGGRLTLSSRNHPGEAAALPPELEPGDYVVVCVADTGIGMAADVLAHAMEPFFTTKGIGEGSGLGLSQAYGFARQLGGTVRLASTPGEGTLAEIFLPRAGHLNQAAAQAAGHALPRPCGLGRSRAIVFVSLMWGEAYPEESSGRP